MVGKDKLPQDYVNRVEAMQMGQSTVSVFLGVNKDYSGVFGESHEIMVTTLWDQEEIYQGVVECDSDKIGFSIGNYSMIDPKAAPPGKNAIVIMSMLDYDCFNRFGWGESRDAVRRQKQKLADLYLDKAEQFMPDIREHIEVLEVATPQTIEGWTLNPRGTFLGWSNVPDQSLLNRLKRKTPIDNLYLSGAWTFPGGGQSAVMMCGKEVADEILQLEASP